MHFAGTVTNFLQHLLNFHCRILFIYLGDQEQFLEELKTLSQTHLNDPFSNVFNIECTTSLKKLCELVYQEAHQKPKEKADYLAIWGLFSWLHGSGEFNGYFLNKQMAHIVGLWGDDKIILGDVETFTDKTLIPFDEGFDNKRVPLHSIIDSWLVGESEERDRGEIIG